TGLSAGMSSELRRYGITSTPAARSCSISTSTMRFSPEGAADRYRLCATTTFTAADATPPPTRRRTVAGMPELPEVEALASYLRERAVWRVVDRVEVGAV